MARIKVLFALLYITGLALICLAFVLLVPAWLPRDVVWLDFLTVCAVYSVNLLGFVALRGDAAGFARRIPRLAIFLCCDPLYTLAALGVAWRGAVIMTPFQPQLILQLALAILMGAAAVAALEGAEHIHAVTAEESSLAGDVRELQQALAGCEVALFSRGLAWSGFRSSLEKLKEDVRFLSPCTAPSARSLEAELIATLRYIGSVAVSADESRARAEFPGMFEHCHALMALRRNVRIDYGERG